MKLRVGNKNTPDALSTTHGRRVNFSINNGTSFLLFAQFDFIVSINGLVSTSPCFKGSVPNLKLNWS